MGEWGKWHWKWGCERGVTVETVMQRLLLVGPFVMHNHFFKDSHKFESVLGQGTENALEAFL